jgi:putative SOS response-associated peptidase YedK
MCGRYTIAKPELIVIAFEPEARAAEIDGPRYNIAPMQSVPIIATLDGNRTLTDCQWGFVPHWAKDPEIANRMINARGETVAEKPSFRSAFSSHRCLIPADGFYEWQKTAEGKQPIYFRVDDGDMFAFAGLYSRWQDSLLTCIIITTEPNELVKPIHLRMPVILPRDHWGAWMDPQMTDKDALKDMLRPFDAKRLSATPVSKRVNSPANDDEGCVRPMR